MNLFRQFIPPRPSFTESDLPDLHGRVYIVTGGYSGIGLELSAMLYRAGAAVYLAGRSEASALKAIEGIEAGDAPPAPPAPPPTITTRKRRLHYMPLHLDDLSTIPSSAHWFLQRESRLDVLWNNAGVRGAGLPPTRQGNEMHMGTNCLGHFLLTRLLHPLLEKTSRRSLGLKDTTAAPEGDDEKKKNNVVEAASVRVIWLSSLTAHLSAPRGGGMDLDSLECDAADGQGQGQGQGYAARYVASKVGAVFVAAEWARRDLQAGIVHISINPGNVRTPLQRHMGCIERAISNTMLYPAKYGAYAELWAGLSPDITQAHSGRYALPWGRWGPMRADIEEEMTGGEGSKSLGFFRWCEGKTDEWAGGVKMS